MAHTGNCKHWRTSIWYVQFRDALDRAPSMKDFGKSKFEYLTFFLADEPRKDACNYSNAIESALTSIVISWWPGGLESSIREPPPSFVWKPTQIP